jgi:hypothetical protein
MHGEMFYNVTIKNPEQPYPPKSRLGAIQDYVNIICGWCIDRSRKVGDIPGRGHDKGGKRDM